MTHAETRERDESIAAAAVAGAMLTELCERFGVSYSTAWEACQRQGVTVPRKPTTVGSDVFAVLAKLKDAAFPTDAAVAREFGLSPERIRQIKERAKQYGLL